MVHYAQPLPPRPLAPWRRPSRTLDAVALNRACAWLPPALSWQWPRLARTLQSLPHRGGRASAHRPALRGAQSRAGRLGAPSRGLAVVELTRVAAATPGPVAGPRAGAPARRLVGVRTDTAHRGRVGRPPSQCATW